MNTENEQLYQLYHRFIALHIDEHHKRIVQNPAVYDYYEFPIYWDRRLSLEEYLFRIFKVYIEELKHFNTSESAKIDVDSVTKICNAVLNSFHEAMQWNLDKALQVLDKCGIYEELLTQSIETILDGKRFYRLRADDCLIDKNDFLHVPFTTRYKCNCRRFSMAGTPCLYLGYSEEVCRKELEKPTGGSIGKFVNTKEFKVIDLTLNMQRNQNVSFFQIWPILAACYVTPPDRDGDFKEEYLFPQIIMKYIETKIRTTGNDKNIIGIRYYTCRYKNLDVRSERYMNIALFTSPKYLPIEEQHNKGINIEGDYPYLINNPYDESLSELFKFEK